MAVVWLVAGVVMVLVGAVILIGSRVPRDHVATGSVVVAGSPERVWTMIRAVSEVPRWRPSVSAVENIEGPANAPTAWTERSGRDSLRFEAGACAEGRSIETRIVDTGLPFGGAWTIEVAPEGAGTRVTVTERGFVKPPPFRFVAKYIMGHDATLRKYLRDLENAFGPTG